MFIQQYALAAISAADYTFARMAHWKLISGNHHLPMPESCAGSG
jgi:hypothetical protein